MRIAVNVELENLSEEHELKLVLSDIGAQFEKLHPVIDGEGLLRFQSAVRDVAIPAAVQKYIVNITSASRPGTPDALELVNKYVAWGAGVRATQFLALGAKARAALQGRGEATAADVKATALPVLRHRIGVNFRAENDSVPAAKIVAMLLEKIQS